MAEDKKNDGGEIGPSKKENDQSVENVEEKGVNLGYVPVKDRIDDPAERWGLTPPRKRPRANNKSN